MPLRKSSIACMVRNEGAGGVTQPSSGNCVVLFSSNAGARHPNSRRSLHMGNDPFCLFLHVEETLGFRTSRLSFVRVL